MGRTPTVSPKYEVAVDFQLAVRCSAVGLHPNSERSLWRCRRWARIVPWAVGVAHRHLRAPCPFAPPQSAHFGAGHTAAGDSMTITLDPITPTDPDAEIWPGATWVGQIDDADVSGERVALLGG